MVHRAELVTLPVKQSLRLELLVRTAPHLPSSARKLQAISKPPHLRIRIARLLKLLSDFLQEPVSFGKFMASDVALSQQRANQFFTLANHCSVLFEPRATVYRFKLTRT